MSEENKKKNFDFTNALANVSKAKAMKAAKEKKQSVSIKPLKFTSDPEDSPLKASIIEKINEEDLTYSDMYKYCTTLRNGDISEGQKLGYNIISGLKHRHTMIDTTFSILCDFLGLDVILVKHKEDDSDDADAPADSEDKKTE
jgi:hypothetical protein